MAENTALGVSVQPRNQVAPTAAPQQAGAAADPAAAAQEESIFKEWIGAFKTPEVRGALAQFGISALQPLQAGDTELGQLGRAVASGGAAAGRITATGKEDQKVAEKQRIEQEKIRVVDEATSARSKTAAEDRKSREKISGAETESAEGIARTRITSQEGISTREIASHTELTRLRLEAEATLADINARRATDNRILKEKADDARVQRSINAGDKRTARKIAADQALEDIRYVDKVTENLRLDREADARVDRALKAGVASDKLKAATALKTSIIDYAAASRPVGSEPLTAGELGAMVEGFIDSFKKATETTAIAGAPPIPQDRLVLTVQAIREQAAGNGKSDEEIDNIVALFGTTMVLNADRIGANFTSEMWEAAVEAARDSETPGAASPAGGATAEEQTGQSVLRKIGSFYLAEPNEAALPKAINILLGIPDRVLDVMVEILGVGAQVASTVVTSGDRRAAQREAIIKAVESIKGITSGQLFAPPSPTTPTAAPSETK